MIMRNTLAAALAVALCCAHAQAAEPALPSTSLKVPPVAPSLSVNAPDVAFLASEDSKANGQPLRIGVPTQLNRDLIANGAASDGGWAKLPDGRRLWTTTIQSDDAVSLDLHFSQLDLPDGAELYLANADGSYVLGPIRGSDALADGQYYSHLVPGELMRLELTVPEAERSLVNLALASVTYGYRDVLGFGGGDHPDAIQSGSCNVDVACPLGDDWTDQIQGVGQYIFQDGGSYVCSGTLIANTAGTPTPYFITADHCVGGNTIAQTMRVYWNYESAECRAPGSAASGSSLPRPATYSNGATQRANYPATDVSLVELNAPVPVTENPFFVGWDRRNVGTAGNPSVDWAVSIHHPAGHEKRISLESDPVAVTGYLSSTPSATGTHLHITDWDEGTTEGGSSGSSLFNPDGHLIGVLTGGYAACGNNQSDWYGRIYQAWEGGGSDATSLAPWLDADGSAPDSLDGYYGTPLGEADLALTLAATPNPVDIGEQVTLTAEVENLGPDAATGVSVSIELPVGLSYASGGGGDWTCATSGTTVACDLTGDLASAASAAALDVLADVDATEAGTVTVTATTNANESDADSANNEAGAEIEITGEPPLDDLIFADGFEEDSGPAVCEPLQLLEDPSLEATIGNADANDYWAGTDSNDASATPFWPNAARTGNYGAWGGGWGEPGVQTWSQSVTIPAGSARFLNFWRSVNSVPTGTATLKAFIGTEEVYSLDAVANGFDDGFLGESVDVSSFANGALHEVRFEYSAAGGDDGNVFVDDITLDCEPAAGE